MKMDSGVIDLWNSLFSLRMIAKVYGVNPMVGVRYGSPSVFCSRPKGRRGSLCPDGDVRNKPRSYRPC